MKSNLIAAKDISTDQLSPHHFNIQQKLEEDSISHLLRNMYELGFSERHTDTDLEYSIEDKRFLALMDIKVKMVDGHYQVPIPFRNTIEKINSLPSNKDQVKRRMLGLKKRLTANPKTLEDYKVFMSKLFEKKFAQRVTSDDEGGWYTPHFGVYHPAKSEKIRVVFNYSASFFGTTLNDHIIQGPDLTNHLLGVLMRFRQEKVAMMADVESMFYQVKVPDDQLKYLKFLARWKPRSRS